jgi:3,4-dihydroxy 2-butanone 4-phosphate synthase/GTP cyclohydrolase II
VAAWDYVAIAIMSSEAKVRVERALEEIRLGRMVILVDDEDRENEGDLVMAADAVTPEAINFMARHARGLICLSLTEERVKQLDLPMMVEDNRSSRSTAFTISIEARQGVSTGISAADRARTVAAAVAPNAKPRDIVSPGHVFPLKARPGGVLQRSGHTEGSVDLARLAGRQPSGVICEIMKDDGTMARYPDLVEFAQEHGLVILSIADLIQYRLANERLVDRRRTGPVTLETGTTWQAHVYGVSVEERQALALTLGEIDATPTLVRVHTGSVLADVFGVRTAMRVVLSEAIERIEEEGRGVILFLPGKVDLDRDLAFHLGDELPPVAPTDRGEVLREYGVGAQILSDLGLRRIRLLTNRPRRIAGLDGYGLEVVDQLLLAAPQEEATEHTTH